MRLVVGLDGTPYADATTRVACSIAEALNGTAVGVAVTDEPGIEASSRGAGIGAYAYAKMVREQRFANASERAAEFLRGFEATCADSGVPFELAHRAGVPFQCIVDEGRYADLIVVGSRTHFHFETSDSDGDTLRRLMNVCVCPVLAVPKDIESRPTRAVIAIDGSIQSARAMRAYVSLIGRADSPPAITLLHVGENSDEDNQVQLETAKRYVESYGLEADIRIREGKPSREIEALADELGDSMIVMGAYGRRGVIRDIFFGSTAAQIIKSQRVPLFVYH